MSCSYIFTSFSSLRSTLSVCPQLDEAFEISYKALVNLGLGFGVAALLGRAVSVRGESGLFAAREAGETFAGAQELWVRG